MARPRSRTARKTTLGASFVLLLTTIASLFAAQLGPAFALARLAGASFDGPAMSAPREGESVTSRESRSREVYSVKRSGRGEGGIGPAAGATAPALPPGEVLASVAPLAHPYVAAPERVTWETPGRHRARLMVFLN